MMVVDRREDVKMVVHRVEEAKTGGQERGGYDDDG